MAQEYVVENRGEAPTLKKGFTLIELMIAMVIIGLIAGGSIYFAMGFLESAKRTSTKTKLQSFKVVLMNYKTEKGEYPQKLDDLVKASFLPKPLPVDGWEKPFVYRRTPDGEKPYELYSYGPKGKGGGKASRIYP
ncbi:prepilin-type N-terminal cleavage/methylation domain-containing protein [Candidatus Dependentiae bacterium]|nr:MAG: prepilin-type N-terminal cleavage/methylation domain-containing protein [Candidatus Dependentiae bacterium]